MATIVFQGDSITDCGRLTCGGAGYPQGGWGPGYPGIIGSLLTGRYPDDGWQIFNRGISGHRVVDLYARWKLDTLNLNPDIVSILVGVNDTMHEIVKQNGVEVPRFDRFYRMLLDWTLETNSKVKFVLMEPFVRVYEAVTEDWLPEIHARQAVVRKIAEDYRECTAFVPLQEIFDRACAQASDGYYSVDGVHPQPAGHQLIADAWLEAVAGFPEYSKLKTAK